MQLQDDALTGTGTLNSKARGLPLGRWWRWSRYELKDAYIRPAPGARLTRYDPWKVWLKTRPVGRRSNQGRRGATPYRELLDMLERLRYRSDSGDAPEFTPAQVDMTLGPLSNDSEKLLLDFCARYGLLGILPHRVLQVTLPPMAGGQLQYTRIGSGWMSFMREVENPLTPMLPPRAIVQPLRGTGIEIEPLTRTWTRFFPTVTEAAPQPFVYPEPLTDEFWEQYAEPLDDFLTGARALREALGAIVLRPRRGLRHLHEALTGGLPIVFGALVAPTGLGVPFDTTGRPGLNWVGHSLLASLSLMLLEDLAGARALRCPCGRAFVSTAYQAHYCSRRCRWRFEQRKLRGKHKKAYG